MKNIFGILLLGLFVYISVLSLKNYIDSTDKKTKCINNITDSTIVDSVVHRKHLDSKEFYKNYMKSRPTMNGTKPPQRAPFGM